LFDCSFFMSMFVFWSSVSFHSHSMWSTDRWVLQKGHSGLLTPSILGPWVALVYPVLSLDIATCSFLSISFASSFLSTSGSLSYISLFPFFHLWSLILKSSLVNHFFRLAGRYLSVLDIAWSSAYFGAAWSVFSFPGIPL
jgi:hypothetical protein